LARRRATLHDFMALSYGPARALAYDRRCEFRAWVDCDDHHGRNFCLARCNAQKRVQAFPTMPLHGANTVDAPLQERVKSRKKNRGDLRDRKPPLNVYSTESGHISLRALTVSRQRASGILLKKCCTRFFHQLSPMSQMACLTFTTPDALFRAHCGS
jgi:hypothetical protein